MSVLDRDALEASPLADLHAIASELSIDGYRRLRRAELIDAILGRQSDEVGAEPAAAGEEEAETASDEKTKTASGRETAAASEEESGAGPEEETPRRRRGRRSSRARSTPAREEADASEPSAPPAERTEDESVEGVVELLPNGSGFVRVEPPEPSDRDVYISAAQVKRCELVTGDRIAGPRRAPRRSERFASLVRIDTINGRPADEVADSARFDDLPAVFPDERFRFGSEDPTIKAIEWLTPIGRGSRVTITGASGSGKTEALRRIAQSLGGHEELQLSLAAAGVRPEEIPEWKRAGLDPGAAAGLGSSSDAQGHAVELVVDQGRRVAARGAHAVVLLDSLDGLHPLAAQRALAAARNLVDGGSLTVIATASEPIGGETTVIALDATLASAGRFPALDLTASRTIRTELLVGEAGAEAIARARAEALDSA
jgi:transcription termination factor Rho